ncbi:MAG: MFS transporter [Proteobacteria bacterium]|nr:MFS transporter [Pseudomonadota bacterium]
MNGRDPSSRFWRISAGGIFFQGGAAAVDSSTIIAALVHGLTGSSFAVGAASAILRYGWLFPQIFVAYFAQRRRRRMPFYMVGAFGRATCLIGIAALLAFAGSLPGAFVVAMFFALWTLYAFVSGIVAVPYNDIVARSVPSARRSRLLALRFFGGGLLALGVAAAAHRLLAALPFPAGTAAIVLIGAVLLYVSSLSFVSAGEPDAPPTVETGGFGQFLRQGLDVFRTDHRFRIFVYAQWLGGAVMMSMPFYILQVMAVRGPPSDGASDIAFLLGAQTVGALASNALWGWWGDRHGKRSLLEGVALLRVLPPLLTLFLVSAGGGWGLPAYGDWALPAYGDWALPPWAGFAAVFMLLGALINGGTIAMLGYLMEISPDHRRPAYSGYFNALVAPAALLPIAGAAIAESVTLSGVFVVSLAAAILQYLTVRRLRHVEPLGAKAR